MTYKVLKRVLLQEKHFPTGETQHFLGAQLLPKPSELMIARFDDDAEVYLLYLNAQGEEITDTLHDSIADALNQAEREFRIKPFEWEDVAE
jgi:hypothetical protein